MDRFDPIFKPQFKKRHRRRKETRSERRKRIAGKKRLPHGGRGKILGLKSQKRRKRPVK